MFFHITFHRLANVTTSNRLMLCPITKYRSKLLVIKKYIACYLAYEFVLLASYLFFRFFNSWKCVEWLPLLPKGECSYLAIKFIIHAIYLALKTNYILPKRWNWEHPMPLLLGCSFSLYSIGQPISTNPSIKIFSLIAYFLIIKMYKMIM